MLLLDLKKELGSERKFTGLESQTKLLLSVTQSTLDPIMSRQFNLRRLSYISWKTSVPGDTYDESQACQDSLRVSPTHQTSFNVSILSRQKRLRLSPVPSKIKNSEDHMILASL